MDVVGYFTSLRSNGKAISNGKKYWMGDQRCFTIGFENGSDIRIQLPCFADEQAKLTLESDTGAVYIANCGKDKSTLFVNNEESIGNADDSAHTRRLHHCDVISFRGEHGACRSYRFEYSDDQLIHMARKMHSKSSKTEEDHHGTKIEMQTSRGKMMIGRSKSLDRESRLRVLSYNHDEEDVENFNPNNNVSQRVLHQPPTLTRARSRSLSTQFSASVPLAETRHQEKPLDTVPDEEPTKIVPRHEQNAKSKGADPSSLSFGRDDNGKKMSSCSKIVEARACNLIKKKRRATFTSTSKNVSKDQDQEISPMLERSQGMLYDTMDQKRMVATSITQCIQEPSMVEGKKLRISHENGALLTSNVTTLNVAELRRICSNRNIPCRGLRKVELIAAIGKDMAKRECRFQDKNEGQIEKALTGNKSYSNENDGTQQEAEEISRSSFAHMKVTELKHLCKNLGIDTKGLRKVDLIAKLASHDKSDTSDVETASQYDGMKMTELRIECSKRAINTKGLRKKCDFIAQLQLFDSRKDSVILPMSKDEFVIDRSVDNDTDGVEARIDFHALKVTELRAECRSRRLSTAGTKGVLIQRLLDN